MDDIDWSTALNLITSASAFLKKPMENAFTKAVQDGYETLKNHLKKRFSREKDVLDALHKVEAKPESEARQQLLLEELEPHDISQDQELLQLLEMLGLLLQQAGANTLSNIRITQTGTRNKLNFAGRDLNIYEKKVERPIIQPNESHISEFQATEIHDKIVDIARIEKNAGKSSPYGELYAALKSKYKCRSYKTLPAESFVDAMNWLNQEAGKRTRSLRRTNNPEWRKRKYKLIHAAGRSIGLDDAGIKQYAAELFGLKVPPESLKELKERQLDTLAEKLRYRSKLKRQ